MLLDKHPELILATSTIVNGNMSFVRGDPQEALENRKRFLTQQKVDINSIISMNCQHGTEILRVTKTELGKGATSQESAPKVDGFVTNKPGAFLFLLTADCLPLAIYDPQNKAIGLIHVGWKGLHSDILDSAVKTFKHFFDSQPQNLLIYISPSIGPCCYIKQNTREVESDPKWQPYLKRLSAGISIDLWSFTQDQLVSLGIKKENISNSKVCTYHSNQYFSNRKFNVEGLPNNYRFATVLGLKP